MVAVTTLLQKVSSTFLGGFSGKPNLIARKSSSPKIQPSSNQGFGSCCFGRRLGRTLFSDFCARRAPEEEKRWIREGALSEDCLWQMAAPSWHSTKKEVWKGLAMDKGHFPERVQPTFFQHGVRSCFRPRSSSSNPRRSGDCSPRAKSRAV